ncbi:MAG: biopolymer transporter ExbD [Planctomycetota bacterium]
MAIQFQCPKCQSSRQVSERLVGKEIDCPNCGASVMVTAAPQQAQSVQEVQAVAEVVEVQEAVAVPSEVVQAVEATPQAQAVVVAELSPEERQAQEERELEASSASFSKPKAPASDDMDMTPMVDVTFLLLIFFMITASFSVQKTLERPVQKPDDPSINTVEKPEDENPDIVTVQVDEFNAFNVITTEWDRTAASKQNLIVALSDAKAGTSGTQASKLVVQAHEDCMHGAVVMALDAGREAQFEAFEVSTVEEFD